MHRAVAALVGCSLFLAGGVTAYGTSGRGALPETLVPVGHTVGIKLFSEGVLVVGLSELETAGGTAAPAKEGGLKVGDFILECDDVAVESTEHFQSIVAAAAGTETCLTVKRQGKTMDLEVSAVQCEDGAWRLGAWVRDSLAGIGTMTFYDPASGTFGALGHGINDVDTGQLMTLDTGSIMPSTVKAVKKGEDGAPGELRGDFDLQRDLGALYANTAGGVFGEMPAAAMALGEPAAVEYAENNMLQSGSYTIHGVTAQRLDNGYTRYTIDYTAPAGMYTCIFSPPDGNLFKIFGPITTGARETLIFDLEDQVVEQSGTVGISFNFNDDDRFFVFI